MQRHLVFAFLLVTAPLLALENDLSRAFYCRLGIFPDDPRIAAGIKHSLVTGEHSLTWSAAYTDLYRFRDPDGSRAALSALGSHFKLVWPWPHKKSVLSLNGNIFADRYDLSGSNRYVTADPRLYGEQVAGDLYLPAFPAGIGVQLGGAYTRSHGEGSIAVRQFPAAAHQAGLNTYFFNLLEQTFGRVMAYDYNRQAIVGTIQAEKGPFFVQGEFRENDGSTMWAYTNTESTSLAGRRHVDISAGSRNGVLRGGATWHVPAAHRLTGALAYWHYQDTLSMTPLDPAQRKDGMYLDLRDWGGARLDQTGWGGMAGWEWTVGPAGQVQAAAQLGYADFNGSGAVKTPVLGFTYGLPIGHEFSGAVYGTILSQYVQCGGEYRAGKRFSCNARLGYLHTIIDAQVKGRAGMEFNVVTTPVDAEYKLAGHVFDGKVAGEMQINRNFKIGVAIYQIVPIFKQIKEVRHTGPQPGPVSGESAQRTTRGGTEYSVCMQYGF